MGRELRSIILSGDELEAAIRDSLTSRKGGLVHPQNISTLELSESGAVTCNIKFLNPLLDGRSELMLGPEDLIDAIAGYVRAQGHPLPKRGRRSLAWIEGDLALMIELDWF